jgi:hypothetical protein
MAMSQIDRPEPRWQVILALLAISGIYMALPKELIVGPTWLLPVLVVVLLVPTVFAHRTGRHSLNHVLGICDRRNHYVGPHRIGGPARHHSPGKEGAAAGTFALGRSVVDD